MTKLETSLQNSLKAYANCIAIEEGENKMSFKQLDTESNLIAQQIRSRGIFNSFIGIHFERSKEFIVSILGVLKSGNGYIPLDVEDPQQRLSHIVENSQMSCIITSSRHQNRFTSKKVIIYEERDQIAGNNISDIPNTTELAYSIYTSGSSGKPKGVVISRHALWSYLKWCISTYTSGNNKGTILHSSLSYDMSVTSIFVPLLQGQTLHIIKDENSTLKLINLLEQNRGFNLLKLTPSHLKVIKEMF